jgi:hypothetical protein
MTHSGATLILYLNPKSTESASELDKLRKTIVKYYLEEYFGIDVQTKVIDLEF